MGAKKWKTGMTAVYLVAAELCKRDFMPAVTGRNAPGADIVAVTPGQKRTVVIDVKANRAGGTQSFWLLGESAKNRIEDVFYYVFVNLKKGDTRSEFYIVPSKEVVREIGVNETPKGTWYSYSRDEKYKDKWDVLEG